MGMLMRHLARERLERLGRRMRWTVRGFMLLGLAAVLFVLGEKGPLGLVTVPADIAVDPRLLAVPRGLAVAAVGLLEPAAWLLAAALLDRLFGLYARGVVFSSQNTALVRRAGWALVAIDGVRMAKSALTGPVLTWIGATRPYVRVELQVSVAVVGLFVVAVGWVTEFGRELDEDERLTI